MQYSYNNDDALVLLSGGQDSTTSLFWAIKNFKNIFTLSFYYNQKHSDEIKIAGSISKKLKLKHKVIDISFLKNIVISNLFKGSDDVNKKHKLKEDVPSSFVPYRNMIFLTLAAAWASTINVKHIITGVCETDYSGYADCRDIFIKSLEVSLNLATDFDDKLIIHTPLMWLNKTEIFKLSDDLGCLDFIINETMTCYNGVKKINNYGMGCGECPACILRKNGYNEFLRKYK